MNRPPSQTDRMRGLAAAALAAITLAGCAAGDSPQQVGLAQSECERVRKELSVMEARGVQFRADSVARGARLTAPQQEEVNRYNGLLNQYLGGGCAR